SRFWRITLPLLSPTIFFNLVMGVIGSFQVFTQGLIMTGGGPNNSTYFYVLYTYRNAFEFFKMGYASALAWVLFMIVLILTLLVVRSSPWWVFYEAQKR
ncbi:MAG: sugar ABC transporter permease, partial [bacterium]|nr:sugar ABC transporter permease [bacterium]